MVMDLKCHCIMTCRNQRGLVTVVNNVKSCNSTEPHTVAHWCSFSLNFVVLFCLVFGNGKAGQSFLP